MKFKFNLKLTAFMVSLFLSLLLVVLGGKNKYCLSFGFILMGISLILFVFYNNEKTENEIVKIEEDIEQIEESYEQLEDDELEGEDEEEISYALNQLYARKKKLVKHKKKSMVVFNLCGFSLIILGIIGLF